MQNEERIEAKRKGVNEGREEGKTCGHEGFTFALQIPGAQCWPLKEEGIRRAE